LNYNSLYKVAFALRKIQVELKLKKEIAINFCNIFVDVNPKIKADKAQFQFVKY